MNWNNFRIFYYVAKMKNMSTAAQHLNVSPSALSRSILNLEDRLKTKLFERHARGLNLTRQGKILFDEVEKIFVRFELIRQLTNNDEKKPEGEIKVFSDLGLLDTWLSNYISQFISEHPRLYLSILSNSGLVDIVKNEVDVVLCTYFNDSPLIEKKLILTWHRKLYASPDYLKKFGEPQTVNDLDHHRLIAFGEDKTFPTEDMDWHLRIGLDIGETRPPFLTINSMRSILKCAEDGQGIISFSKESLLLKNSNLVEVLPDIIGPNVNVYMIYLKQMREIGRVKAFCDYIEKIAEDFTRDNQNDVSPFAE